MRRRQRFDLIALAVAAVAIALLADRLFNGPLDSFEPVASADHR